MYCSNCGAENRDGAAFCKHCGEKLELPLQAQPAGAAASAQPVRSAERAAAPGSRKTVLFVVKIALVVAMACFFLPFVMVSCAGQEVNFSGVELMTKMSANEDIRDALEDCMPNFFLMGALAAAIVGLIAARPGKAALGGGASAAGAVLLLVFRMTFESFYDTEGLDYSIRWGWGLCLAAMLAAAAAAFYAGFMREPESRPEPHWTQTPMPMAPESTPPEAKDPEPPFQEDGRTVCMQQSIPEELTQPAFPRARLTLRVRSGDTETPTTIDKFPCVVGRERGAADLVISDPKVSRRHLQLSLQDGRLMLEDLGSKNGTAVNGKPAMQSAAVKEGDVICMGATQMIVEKVEI